MKKTLFLIGVIFFLCGNAKGQYTMEYNLDCIGCDTLLVGEREPTFYYWDTNWFDYKKEHYPIVINNWYEGGMGQVYTKSEYARYCYIDTSLRVIGVAAGIYYKEYIPQGWEGDINEIYAKLDTDYFRVYEVDSVSDNMRLVAEAPWTNKTPRISMVNVPYPVMFGRKPNSTPVFEAYFDSAITVHDSFYVAVTTNNNHDFNYSPTQPYIKTSIATVQFKISTPPYTLHGPDPAHFKIKHHELYFPTPRYNTYGINDTNWHAVVHEANLWPNEPDYLPPYMFIFPIIDTSRDASWSLECQAATNLSAMHTSTEFVVLRWDGVGNADHWELMLTPDGSEPDTTNLIVCENDVATINGLDTAQWYTARVRSVCINAQKSEWSDSIRFYVPGDTTSTGTEGIENIVDRNTYVMPNPASDHVTVASSFHIRKIELFALNGTRIFDMSVNALSTILDIHNLASGTYILQITTPKGTAFKKLVVK